MIGLLSRTAFTYSILYSTYGYIVLLSYVHWAYKSCFGICVSWPYHVIHMKFGTYEPLCYFKENPESDWLWRSMYVVKIKHKPVRASLSWLQNVKQGTRKSSPTAEERDTVLSSRHSRQGWGEHGDSFCWKTQLSLQEPCNYQSLSVSSQGTIYRHIIKSEISRRRHFHSEGKTIEQQIRWSKRQSN